MRNCIYIFLFLAFTSNAQLLLVENIDSEHSGNWQFRKKGETEWKSAQIPGSVFTDLMHHKLIPDPFISDNEKKVQWVESCDWEHKSVFRVTGEQLKQFTHTDLVLEGIDTYAKIFLNDSLIFSSENAFRQWKRDVKKFLKVGDNALIFTFESSVNRGKAEAAKLTYTLPEGEKVFTRKPQFSYGWDFAPRLVGCGITRSPRLEFWKETRIKDLHFAPIKIDSSIANIRCNIEIESDQVQKINLALESYNQSAKINLTSDFTLKKGINKIGFNVMIQKPELWWCKGMGNPSLYVFKLTAENSKKEKVSLERSIGLRTIDLIQEKDAAGKSFYFKLNGKAVFMKGANYIPPDVFSARTPDYTFPRTAAEMNMNMLRVWGGGTYPSDDFYSQCDEQGILVWQDLMFACAMYPGDEKFTENVKQEISEQVKRLRDHPSLALFCGNNEIDEGWNNWGWQKQFHYSKKDSAKIYLDYKNLFETVVPKIIKENCQTVYWPSSPSIGWGHKESLQEGDSHYWGVWWGNEPFETYEKKVGRFMSEYGFQGMPSHYAFKQFCTEEKVDLNSPSVKHHQKHATGYQTIQKYLERDYKTPMKLDDYIYVSQLLQANGMKTAIEAHRRAKPYCMGSLFWQLNDCWPVTSWSAIDYYGMSKALYHYSKRLFKTVLVTSQNENNSIDISIISDSLKELKGNLDLKLYDFKGKLLWEKRIPAATSNSSTFKYSIGKKELASFDTTFCYLHSEFIFTDKSFAASNLFFVKPKDLKLPKVSLNIKKINNETFEISSDVFAKDVYLYNENQRFILSDNFFDLAPGEKKTINVIKLSNESIIPELHAIILNNLINLQ